MLTLKVQGINRVANKFRRLASQNKEILDPTVKGYVVSVRKHLDRKKYPPKLLNQKYVRSGLLGSSYSTRKIRASFHVIRNSRKGAKYVIDESNQAEIHQGRWYTIQGEERKLRPQLTEALTEDIQDYVSN